MRRTAAAVDDNVSYQIYAERPRLRQTSVCNLAGVSSSTPITVFREGWADFAEAFKGGAPSWTFVFCEGDLLLLAGLRVLDRCGNWDDLIIEPSGLLRSLRTLI